MFVFRAAKSLRCMSFAVASEPSLDMEFRLPIKLTKICARVFYACVYMIGHTCAYVVQMHTSNG